jgi:prolyl-tRNA synthetase
MMHDGKALQSGTSHYFGDGFARAFNIQFADRENKLSFPHQTSWGWSTRTIGGIIMTHGDDNGLILPPKIAPIQVDIVPVAAQKGGVNEKAAELMETLKAAGIRVKIDTTDNSPGWKFAEYEMKGVPLRLEVGPRDIEKGECVLVRRDNREKSFVPFTNLAETVKDLLEKVHQSIYDSALARREEMTYRATTLEEIKEIADNKPGFIKAMWCGEEECEMKLKEYAGITSRCIPFEQEHLSDVCPVCGKPANHMVYWGKAY